MKVTRTKMSCKRATHQLINLYHVVEDEVCSPTCDWKVHVCIVWNSTPVLRLIIWL